MKLRQQNLASLKTKPITLCMPKGSLNHGRKKSTLCTAAAAQLKQAGLEHMLDTVRPQLCS